MLVQGTRYTRNNKHILKLVTKTIWDLINAVLMWSQILLWATSRKICHIHNQHILQAVQKKNPKPKPANKNTFYILSFFWNCKLSRTKHKIKKSICEKMKINLNNKHHLYLLTKKYPGEKGKYQYRLEYIRRKRIHPRIGFRYIPFNNGWDWEEPIGKSKRVGERRFLTLVRTPRDNRLRDGI